MSRAPLGYRFLARAIWLSYRLLGWRLDVRGIEHVPATGGAVLTWNHTGHFDFAVVAVPILMETGRWVRLLALRQLWEVRTLRWMLRIGRCVPVDRATTAGRVGAMREAVTALRAGQLVMVAPEGRISPSFDPLPMQPGVVRMAQAAGVPIVPTVSWGSHRFSTTGHRFSLRRGWRLPVEVRVGEPLLIAREDDPTEVVVRLEAMVAALLDEARAGYPDGAPAGAWWVPEALGGGAPAHTDVVARHRPAGTPGPRGLAERRQGRERSSGRRQASNDQTQRRARRSPPV